MPKKYIFLFYLLFIGIVFGIKKNNITKSEVVILSEILASNRLTIYDNAGISHDYIELYNPNNKVIDISGYALSDSERKTRKFIFPKGSILKPYEYYFVWAGKKNKQVKETRLYTNFSVKRKETIYLSDKKGHIIDSVKIPSNMEPDESFSKNIKTKKWVKSKPTPGEKNSYEKIVKPFVLPDLSVKLSHQSGFYSDSFHLSMSVPNDFDIFYTLDVSDPTADSEKYTHPILIQDRSNQENKIIPLYLIPEMPKDLSYLGMPEVWNYTPRFPVDKAVIVKAIAIRKKDGAQTPIKHATFFVGYQDKIGYKNTSVISIITDPKNLFDETNGIYGFGKLWDMNKENNHKNWIKIGGRYANFFMRGKDWIRPAYVEIFNQKHDLKISKDILLKMHGGSSRYVSQKSFKMLFSPEHSFELSNGGCADSLKTKIRDYLVRELLKNKKGFIYAPQELVYLFLDGEFWGEYVLAESFTESFIASFLKQKQETIRLIKDEEISDLSQDAKFEEEIKRGIGEKMDIESFCDFVNINLFIESPDWQIFRRNSWIYYNREKQKYFWLPHDLEWPIQEVHLKVPELLAKTERVRLDPLYKKYIMKEPYRRICSNSFHNLANYYFHKNKVNALLKDIEENKTLMFVKTFQRFKSETYRKENYLKEIEELRYLYNNRFETFMPYMKNLFGFVGDLVHVKKLSSPVAGGKVILNSLELSATETYNGQYYSDYDLDLEVETFPGYEFQYWLINAHKIKASQITLKLDGPKTIQAIWKKVK